MLSNLHCSYGSGVTFHRQFQSLHELSLAYFASLGDSSETGIGRTKTLFADYIKAASRLINDQLRPLREDCNRFVAAPSECSTAPPAPPIGQDDSLDHQPRLLALVPLRARGPLLTPASFAEEDVLALGNRDQPSGYMETHRRISLKFMYNQPVSEEELSECSPAFFKHLQRMVLIYRGQELDIS